MRYVNPKDYGYVSQYVPLNLEIISEALKGKQGQQDKSQALIDDTESKILNITDGYRTQGYSKKINEEFKPMFDELRNIDLTSQEASGKIKNIISKARTHTGLQTVLQDYTKGNPLYDKYSQEKGYEKAIDPNKDKDGNLIQIPYGQVNTPYRKAIDYFDNPADWQKSIATITPELNAYADSQINWDNNGYITITDVSGKTQKFDSRSPETAKKLNGLIDNAWNNGEGKNYWKALQESKGLPSDKNEFARQFLNQAHANDKNNVIDASKNIKIETPTEKTLANRKAASQESEVPEDLPPATPISFMGQAIQTTSSDEFEQGTASLKASLAEEEQSLNTYLSEKNGHALLDQAGKPVYEIQEVDGRLDIVPTANATEVQKRFMSHEGHDNLLGYRARINDKLDQIKERDETIKQAKIASGLPLDYKPNPEILKEANNVLAADIYSSIGKRLDIHWSENEYTMKAFNNLYELQSSDNKAEVIVRLKDNLIKGGIQEKNIDKAILESQKVKNNFLTKNDPKLAAFETKFQELSEQNLMPEDGYRLGADEKSQKYQKEIEETVVDKVLDDNFYNFDGSKVPSVEPDEWNSLPAEERKLKFSYWRMAKDGNIIYGFTNPKINNGVPFEYNDIKNTDSFLVKTGKLDQVEALYLKQMNQSMQNEGDFNGVIGFGNNQMSFNKQLYNTTRKDGIKINRGEYVYKTLDGVEHIATNKRQIIKDYMDVNIRLTNAESIYKDYLSKTDEEISNLDALPKHMRNRQALQNQLDIIEEKLNKGSTKKATPQSSQDNPLGI